jgi:hypothetical protein
MVTVMEEPAVMRKACMRKTRTREAATCETDAVTGETDAAACETHAAGTHAAPHAAEMHSTSMHSASMHAAAAHTATTMAAAPMTAAAAASERGWRKSKRRSHHTRGEAIKELVFHPNSSVLNCSDRYRRKKEDNQHTEMIQWFQMNNATVSDTEVSFAASLYEAFRRLRQRCSSFAMAGYRTRRFGDRRLTHGLAACGSSSDIGSALLRK